MNGCKINLGYYTGENCGGKIDNCLQIMDEYYIGPDNYFFVREFIDPRYPGMENTYCVQFNRNDPFSYICAIQIGGFITYPVFNHLGNYNRSKSYYEQIPEYCDWYEFYNFKVMLSKILILFNVKKK